jgi:hypothetical protein
MPTLIVKLTFVSTPLWIYCRIPFFYQFKSLFILWITLPQIQVESKRTLLNKKWRLLIKKKKKKNLSSRRFTHKMPTFFQGSTYVYVTYVHPFLLEHEVEIDTWLVEMKQRCRQAGTTYFNQFVDRLKALLLAAMLVRPQWRHTLPFYLKLMP